MRGHATALFLLKLFAWMQSGKLILAALNDGWYDYTASTECKSLPEPPLYNGGIMKEGNGEMRYHTTETGVYSPAFLLYNLNQTTRYSFSCWVKVKGADSAIVTARLSTDNSGTRCIGTVSAKSDCWSFLKGGFVLDSSSQNSVLFFQNADRSAMRISVESASLQSFSVDQWSMHQKENIRKKRKRAATIHVADSRGNRVTGASVSVQQISRDFPFGSAIADTILGSSSYQAWFVERFNAAVFENELKWYATEPVAGTLNYDSADKMLDFVRANRIMVRGHNIFWENQEATPSWVRNLTGDDLRSAVNSRIQSLMTRYKGEFAHWDVNNEMLHFNFYEQRLGHNASLEFFDTAQQADPLATLFMNEFNVIETCDDIFSTVDTYVSRLKELKEGGALLEGIGLEGHFGKPNIPLMRAILDKLATLELPIWFTEIDISNHFDEQTQALYLEDVLREAFSHPSVNGIMLWTALHQKGCYEMCLTDWNLRNLLTGDAVDRLLQEWQTKQVNGVTDEHGSYSFVGYLGEYKISASYGSKSAETTLSLPQGDETRHLNIQL
ncbi:endo-1,4-beta-xylanase 5-like [Typha angustifolia]|uniref:endo-1,4-beta-xylanase 5-like n=1 Tax=Typha angustifolia TaxID=59011 RepID=UPI003C2DD151